MCGRIEISAGALVFKGMTEVQLKKLRRLHKLIGELLDMKQPPSNAQSAPCPVTRFASRYLCREHGAEMTSAAIATFYGEVAAAGETPRLKRGQVLRLLPRVMNNAFGVRPTHSLIDVDGKKARGFRGVTVRLEDV